MARNERQQLIERIDNQRGVVTEIGGLRANILSKIEGEERFGRKAIAGRQVSPSDAANVQALVDRFREAALNDVDPEAVLGVWTEIEEMVEGRKAKNIERSGVDSEKASQKFFGRVLCDNFSGEKIKINKRGVKEVSTFESGIGQLLMKKVQQAVMSLGKKKGGEDLKDIFDDGFVISERGLTLFNAIGGDSSQGETIGWGEMDNLSFSVQSLPILDGLNTIRRSLFGRPEPISPIGLVRVFERTGQASDQEIPDKVRVLVENPRMWVNALNEIKRVMSDRLLGKKGDVLTPIYYADFANGGLLGVVNGGIFERGILKKRAQEAVNESLIEWAKPPERRRRRGR